MLLDFEKPISELESKLADMKELAETSDVDVSDAVDQLEKKIVKLKKDTFSNLTRWQKVQLSRSISLSHNPSPEKNWFRLFPLRSPLLRESSFLSPPAATKMFQFAAFARTHLCIQWAVFRVAPFGNPRINACFLLPVAYRR